jgi:hypothetical protein
MAIAQQPHNREIEKAVIDQLGPLGDGEMMVCRLKFCDILVYLMIAFLYRDSYKSTS